MDEEPEKTIEGEIEELNKKEEETFIKLWRTPKFQMMIDIVRVLLLIMVIIITIIFVKEIKAVKMLMYDPCKLCENKTGATCFIGTHLPATNYNYTKVQQDKIKNFFENWSLENVS